MAEDVNVQYLDEKPYAAKYDRQFFRDILTEGIVKTADFEVTEKGTPDMSVNIAKGRAFVQGDQSEWQGHYGIRNDATVNKAIAASDPTNPRKDRVIAQVYDSVDIGGAEDKYVLEVLTGTPAPAPVVPDLPDDALDLAIVDVGNGVTEITNANITDQRNQIATQNVNVAVDEVSGITGAVLKANEIIVMAGGFKIDGSSCELVTTEGTAAKCYAEHLAVAKTEWFDVPKFRVPDTYNGGDIVIKVCFRSAASSKKHSLGIRVASVADGEPHNPDLAAAYQLYNEEVSDATIGDVKIKSVTVTQANHLMAKEEIWHCKCVVEDDAGADADDALFDWISIKWNKG